MKISIITPTYNQDRYIEQTIQSVLRQNIDELEYIIVNDGSTDNTDKIIQKYKGKLIYIRQNNKGQSAAINEGLKRSTGDIIGYLNSDDFFLPNTLKHVLDFFINNTKAFWVCGDYLIVDKDGKKIEKMICRYKRFLSRFPINPTLYLVNYINQPSTFWKREVFNTIGYFDVNLVYTMDYDYWLRLIDNYELYYIRAPLSAFRVHEESKGGSRYKTQFDEGFSVLKRYKKNRMILFAHQLHSSLIKRGYDFLRAY